MTKIIELENRTTSHTGTFLGIQPEHVVSVYVTGESGECGILTTAGVCYTVRGTVSDMIEKINKELRV